MCTDYEGIKIYGRRGRCGFSTFDIQDYTPEPQTPLPAELLNSRRYKTLLPTQIVPTRLQESYKQIMDQGKQVQAQMYNKSTRVLPRLEQSQKVIVQLDPSKNICTPAEIIQCPTPACRSYSLKTIHGRIYTRNRDSSNQT